MKEAKKQIIRMMLEIEISKLNVDSDYRLDLEYDFDQLIEMKAGVKVNYKSGFEDFDKFVKVSEVYERYLDDNEMVVKGIIERSVSDVPLKGFEVDSMLCYHFVLSVIF